MIHSTQVSKVTLNTFYSTHHIHAILNMQFIDKNISVFTSLHSYVTRWYHLQYQLQYRLHHLLQCLIMTTIIAINAINIMYNMSLVTVLCLSVVMVTNFSVSSIFLTMTSCDC